MENIRKRGYGSITIYCGQDLLNKGVGETESLQKYAQLITAVKVFESHIDHDREDIYVFTPFGMYLLYEFFDEIENFALYFRDVISGYDVKKHEWLDKVIPGQNVFDVAKYLEQFIVNFIELREKEGNKS